MTHEATHELLHLVAAAVLVGGGAIFLGLSFRARSGRPAAAAAALSTVSPVSPTPDLATLLTLFGASLSVGAAAIHLAAAPAHLQELGALGWGFVAAAVFQGAWPLAYAILPSRGVVRAGVLVNLAIVGAWLSSRSIGLPGGELAGRPEPIGAPDAAATAFELALVALLLARAAGLDAAIARRLRDAGALATVAIVPAAGVVLLVATVAISLALGHSHPAH